MKNNIILIGMPGAGKSTAGVVLAKALGRGFLDTDILLGTQLGTTLQEFINRRGIDEFLLREEQAALSVSCDGTVIATGGSMVLSETAMHHLKGGSMTVFLDVPLAGLTGRLLNITTRGIALRPSQSIADIYREREPLYRKFADITVPESPGGDAGLEAVVAEIIERLGRMHNNGL